MDQTTTPRGKLKIFLGYADGVGKTYAMLEYGLARKVEGVDVVAAWVETYQQSATDALVHGLERIPARVMPTADGEQLQMDTDATLQRKPQLALVDDLAHRNAPGSRHAQRYQDVLELLQAGISVYSTMNVQSLESLNDIVRQITGVTIEETVPDSLLDEADELELVDVPPEEVLQRLREGKTRAPLSAAYTQIGELAALRQMALRETAERVDEDMRDYMAKQAIQGPWPAAERILVCLSAHPIGDRLVRAGRRMAEANHAEWFVVFVETPRHLQMDPGDRAHLMYNLRVAEEIGAHAVMLTGESVVDALLDYARSQNITRIVIGKPRRSRWLELVRGSRVDRLLERCGNVDVFVISDEGHPDRAGIPPTVHMTAPLGNYLAAAGLSGLATLVGAGLERWLAPANLIMFFLVSVMLAAALWGTGPAVLAAVLCTGAFVWLSAEQIIDVHHLVTLGGLLAVGLLVGTLAGWLRAQIKAARRREIQSAALNALSRDLTVALTLDEMLAAVTRHVSQTFNCATAVLLPELDRLGVRTASPGLELNASDLTAAEWTFANRQPAGAGTKTLPEARVRCLPLETRSKAVGVLAVLPHVEGQFLSPDQRELLAGFDSLAALAIERAQLNQQARQAEILQTTEKLQAALLNSISHDLRTPLSTVSGAISSLLEAEQAGEKLERAIRLDLLENADEEADRLNQLVGNLLDMTRLEAGMMRVRKRLSDVQDVIGSALVQASKRLAGHPIQTNIPENLPPVAMDFVLVVQALYNLLDNAVKYSPAGAEIEVTAALVNQDLRITVGDRGLGIPTEDLDRIFDKFYRVQRPDGVSGTGLGLSICRGIVEVHGGKIWAENRPAGGTIFCFTLPLQAEEIAQEGRHG